VNREGSFMNDGSKQSFWTTLPGILTGIAALISALTGLWLALDGKEQIPTSRTPSHVPSSVPHDVPATSPEIVCEPGREVRDPKFVAETFGLLLGGGSGDPEIDALQVQLLRQQLCGPLVARGYTASAVYEMSPAELMRVATEMGLLSGN
jgi:hypothetical protein